MIEPDNGWNHMKNGFIYDIFWAHVDFYTVTENVANAPQKTR